LGERSEPVCEALRTVARGRRSSDKAEWKAIGAGPAARLPGAGQPARAFTGNETYQWVMGG
jgi:hypothetical protein